MQMASNWQRTVRLIRAASAFGAVLVLAIEGHSATNDAAARAVVENAGAKQPAASQSNSSRLPAGVETNFFITFNPSEFSRDVTPQKIEEARRSQESRPAAQDPKGNWGSVSEGFELSVRLGKETYQVGEPIAATILIRNAIRQQVFYRDFFGMEKTLWCASLWCWTSGSGQSHGWTRRRRRR